MGRTYSTALTPKSSQLAWYDREPIDRTIGYSGSGIAPHTATVRASYTVPTGKKVFVGGLFSAVRRATAATTLGLVMVYANWQAALCYFRYHINNTVDSLDQGNHTIGAVLLEGQVMQLMTWDTSTGGTIDYRMGVVLTEFWG